MRMDKFEPSPKSCHVLPFPLLYMYITVSPFVEEKLSRALLFLALRAMFPRGRVSLIQLYKIFIFVARLSILFWFDWMKSAAH